MPEHETSAGGTWAVGKRLVDALLALAETRVRLFASEVRSEKLRLVGTLLRFAVALAFGLAALFLGTLTIAILAWDMARYAGLMLMTGVFLAAFAFLLWRIRETLRKEPTPFTRTVREFEKDRECLTPKN